MFCAAIGGFVGLLTFETHSFWTAAAAGAIIGGAIVWYRRERFRDRTPLPVPTLEQLKLGAEVVDDPATREARRKELENTIEQLGAGLKPAETLARVRDEAYDALTRAEPLRAFVCFRRIEKLQPGHPETDMLGAVALAMLGADASPWVNAVAKNTGLHSNGSLWAAAWALQLMRRFENAEPMLEELKRRVPGEITYVGLLAVCQAKRGKLQSALEGAQAAFDAQPASTWRRELLVDLLVSAGRLDEAEKRLSEVSVADDPGLVLSALRLKLMKGELADADRWLARVRGLPEPGPYLLSAGGSFEQARCDEQARACYEAALAVGYYPAAELGLARLALHARDHAAVERHALAAINVSRPLATKAIGPLPLFLSAIGLLNAIQPRSRRLTAWLVTAPPEPTLGAFQRHTFLVYSARKESALECVSRVLTAAVPDQTAVAPDRFSVAIATEDRQPLGAVHPGIQAVWG
jgi:tetratricopeptide (TPR) repeat protein